MTTIDVAPIINQVVVPILSAVLLTALSWAATRIASYFHIKLQDSQRAVLSTAVNNGIAYAQQALAGRENVTLGDKASLAVSYILPKVPGALKSLGVTPDHLSQLVTAQLPQAPLPQP